MKNSLLTKVSVLMSVCMVIVCAMLVRDHVALTSGKPALFCPSSGVGVLNCEEVTGSRFGSIFGIPVAVAGLSFSIWIAVALIAFVMAPFKGLVLKVIRILGSVGLGIALAFLAISVIAVGHLCTLCLVFDGLLAVLVFSVWKMPVANRPDEAPAAGEGKKTLVAATVSAVFTFLVLGKITAGSGHTSAPKPEEIAAVEKVWAETTEVNIPSDPFDPWMGPQSAPFVITVFSDFQCPWCSKAARPMRELMSRYPEKVAVRFKHYPLDSACNPNVEQTVHQWACRMSFAAQCAHDQGFFQPFHDTLFESQEMEPTDANLRDWSRKLGVNADQLLACMKEDKVAQEIRLHSLEGNALEIRGTPSVFVNNRPWRMPPSVEIMEALMKVIGVL